MELQDFGKEGKPVLKKKDFIFALSLLGSIKDGLEYLTRLRSELSNTNSMVKSVEIFEKNNSKVTSTLAALNQEEKILKELIEVPKLESQTELVEYFTRCLEHIHRALDWYSTKEEELFSQLGTLSSGEFLFSTSTLEEMAERIALKSIEADGKGKEKISLEARGILQQAKDLLQDLRRKNEQAEIERVEKVIQYLHSIFPS